MTTHRFDRQLTIPGFDAAAQKRLSDATVTVAGIGGVGGTVATYLAAAGVGKLILVHPGELEEPDLNRQTLMRPEWIGSPRVDCARDTLRAHYPDVEVVTHDWALDNPGIPEVIASADAVIDARHNFPERFAINRMCLDAGRPLVVAAMNATEGFLLTVTGEKPCLRCVFPDADPAWEPLEFPVLGAVSGMVGTLGAMEAIKLITGYGRPVDGMLYFDLWDTCFRTLSTRRDPECIDCAHSTGASAASAQSLADTLVGSRS